MYNPGENLPNSAAIGNPHPFPSPSPGTWSQQPLRTLSAVQAHEAFRAFTHISLIRIYTGAPVLAGVGEAGGRHREVSCKKDSS